MKRDSKMLPAIVMISAVLIIPLVLAARSWGQYTQNAASSKKDLSVYPEEARVGYRIYEKKCSVCHQTDNLTRKLTTAPSQNEFWLKKMQAMPSTDLKDRDIASILKFLAFENTRQTSQAETRNGNAGTSNSQSAAEGRQFYVEQNCNVCHSIGSEKGSGGPPLDSVGRRLSREQLMNRMKALRSGTDSSMPPLPGDTSDGKLNALADYLGTLQAEK